MRVLFFLLWAPYFLISQETENENNDILFLSINHTLQIPAGDMKKRFGNNSDISLSLTLKKHNQITISLECGALFGPTVKDNNLFNPIDGNNGSLISQNGEIPTIRLFERGGHIDVSIGKFIKTSTKRSNSGVLFSIGTGYIYHKIFIETLTTELPQLNSDLIKGYDRLSGGLLTKQFVGYLHFSEKNNFRYFIGFESIQAFTKDLREYNYSIQEYVNHKRRDYLFGFKCGFIVPINERQKERYYYY